MVIVTKALAAGALSVGSFALAPVFGVEPAAPVDTGCGGVEILAPRGVVSDIQPLIEWSLVPQASDYRVELESRVPEGQTLVKLDTPVAGTRFRPPRALTDYRARVSVKVTPNCAGGAHGISQAIVFQIDASAACRLVPESVRLQETDGMIRWEPVPLAASYRVSVFAAADGALLAHTEVPRTQFQLPQSGATPAIVVIRPRCRTGWGEPVYRPVLSK